MSAGMILAALALVQSAAAPAPAPPPAPAPTAFPQTVPADILAALASAEGALADVSACFGEGAAVAPARLDALDTRLRQLTARASGVWGAQLRTQLMIATNAVPSCASGAPAALARADNRVTALAARLETILAPLKTSVWFGPMPLCRFGPVAHEMPVDQYTARVSLVMKLHPGAATELAALTTRQVGSALALRAGGRIIFEPVINEPVTGGQIQISGPNEAELQRLAAALRSCPKPPPPTQP